MTLPTHWFKRRRSIVHQLSSTAASEAIQAVANAALAGVGLAPAGPVLAGVLKDVVVIIAAKTSGVRSVDPLVLGALLKGLDYLLETADHAANTSQEIASRNDLFARAHDCLKSASLSAANSRDDSVFIAALDCVALACHDGRHTLAVSRYARMKEDLCVLQEAAEELAVRTGLTAKGVAEFDAWSRRVGTLGIDGIILIRNRKNEIARQLQRKSDEATQRVALLRSMASLAERVLNARNVSVDDAATLKALADAWHRES